MTLQRLFTSAAMNPANVTVPATMTSPGTAAYGPSGVPGGTTAPFCGNGVVGTVQFPVVAAGGALLVRNNGPNPAVLYYDDTLPNGSPVWAAVARANPNSGGCVVIPPGQHRILTNTNAGPIATYVGGPLTLFAGTIQYAVLSDPPDHPLATVLA